MRIGLSMLLLLCAFAYLAPAPALAAVPDDDFLGRWDITMPPAGEARGRAMWLEVIREGGILKGRFQAGGGAAVPVAKVEIVNGELIFHHTTGRPPKASTIVHRARIRAGRLEGTETPASGAARLWVGVRPPAWPDKPPKRKPGKPVELFNGKDVAGWIGQRANEPRGWIVKDGLLMNELKADNIYSSRKFTDFKLEVEFNVDKDSNSGIYLRGRYEIQVRDSYGQPLDGHSQGALYGFIVPPVNASKPAGEWQKIEATIVANRVTVILNGTKIIDDGIIPGITGGALDANEAEPGPIMLQGDHGKVQFRKVTVIPLE